MMLQKRGISYKGKRVMDFSIPACQTEEQSPKPVAHKKPKLEKPNPIENPSTSDLKDISSGSSDINRTIPGLHQRFCSDFVECSNALDQLIHVHILTVFILTSLLPSCCTVILSTNMKRKGGPRTELYAVCKKMQWPLPSFDSKEYKDR
jgi:hypothetical protein